MPNRHFYLLSHYICYSLFFLFSVFWLQVNEFNSMWEDKGENIRSLLLARKVSRPEEKNYILRQYNDKFIYTLSLHDALPISTVICPLETEPEYTEKDVLLLSSEEDIKKAITDADTVIADPIYKTICSEKVNFVAMPHEAYSGRIYRKEVCDFIH